MARDDRGSDAGWVPVSKNADVPIPSSESKVSDGDLKQRFYVAKNGLRLAGTPESWIYVSGVFRSGWAAPEELFDARFALEHPPQTQSPPRAALEEVRFAAIAKNEQLAILGGYGTDILAWSLSNLKEAKRQVQGPFSLCCGKYLQNSNLLITAGYDGKIKLWDCSNLTVIRTIEGHVGEIYALEVLPDEKTLITGGQDQTIRFWEIGTGRNIALLHQPAPVIALATSPDGKIFLSSNLEHDSITIWNVQDRRQIGELHSETPAIQILYSRKGDIILSVHNDGSAKVWRASSGKIIRSIDNLWPQSIDFSSQGDLILVADSSGNLIELNAFSGKEVLRTPEKSIDFVKYITESKAVVASGSKVKAVDLE